jgi:phage-related protein
MLRASVTKVVNFGFLGDLSDVIDDIGDAVADVVDYIGGIIASEVGDVWQWMKNKANSVGRIVKGTVTGILQFFAKIGEKVYHAVLDTVHVVVGAVEWVFDRLRLELRSSSFFFFRNVVPLGRYPLDKGCNPQHGQAVVARSGG